MTTAPTRVAPIASSAETSVPRRGHPSAQRIAGWIVVAALLAFGVFSLTRMGFNAQYLTTASQKVHAFFGNTANAITLPPLGDLVYLIGLTLGVVVLGTVVAALLSLPIAYLAASNTAPAETPPAGVGRALGVVTRAVPDVVIAFSVSLMFALGSTIPGVIAIGIHSIGMISKLFADAIEQVDEGPCLAIRAAGGSRSQEFWSGVFPQVLPSWIATTLHRFDINLRGSAILGYAGVGGLGYAMSLSFNQFQYGRGLGIAIVIFGLCVVLEVISSSVRLGLLGAQPTGRGVGDRVMRAATRRRKTGNGPSPSGIGTVSGSASTDEATLRGTVDSACTAPGRGRAFATPRGC